MYIKVMNVMSSDNFHEGKYVFLHSKKKWKIRYSNSYLKLGFIVSLVGKINHRAFCALMCWHIRY